MPGEGPEIPEARRLVWSVGDGRHTGARIIKSATRSAKPDRGTPFAVEFSDRSPVPRYPPPVLASLLLAAVLASSDPSADLDRARSLAASGDLKAAGDLLRSVAAAFPTWGLAQIELAKVLLDSGGDDPTLDKTLAAARSLEPLNPRAWVLSGRGFAKRGDAARAVEAYQRAVDLRPDLPDGRAGLGTALFEAGRYAEAVPHLKLAAGARAEDRTLCANLAEACEKSGDLAGAEAALRALIDAAPKNAIFRRRLVDFLERTGQADRARVESKKLDALNPGRKLRPLPASSH